MTDATDGDDLEGARRETRAAFENRAMMYLHIYEELADELGPDRATELMKRAIRRRGEETGRKYRAAAAAGDLEGLGEIFCETSPCGGELFEPGVEESGEDRIVLRMRACPLVDAWQAAGLRPDEVDVMCDIAAAVDEGTFEAAGLELTFLDRRGCQGSDQCLLELRIPAGGVG